MKKYILILLIACMAGFRFSATAVDHTVQVIDNEFIPSTLNINVGDRVIWQLQPSAVMPHNVTSSWANSPDLTPSNTTFSFTFNNSGTFPYYCSYHGTLTSGMRGVVNVASVTSIGDDKAIQPLMEVYPNPASEIVSVKLNTNAPKGYKIKLTNMIGQTVSVISDTEFNPSGEGAVKLYIHTLPTGIYFLRLISDDKIMDTRRLLLKK